MISDPVARMWLIDLLRVRPRMTCPTTAGATKASTMKRDVADDRVPVVSGLHWEKRKEPSDNGTHVLGSRHGRVSLAPPPFDSDQQERLVRMKRSFSWR